MVEVLKYRIIKSKDQYDQYCRVLDTLIFDRKMDKEKEDEIEILTLLIETYDKDTSVLAESDPVQLLKSLMNDHSLKSKDLVKILGVSKGLVSDILNYKKGFSKEVIRKLANHFKLDQEAFNRPYDLKTNKHQKQSNSTNHLMGSQKNAKRLKESLNEFEKGGGHVRELVD